MAKKLPLASSVHFCDAIFRCVQKQLAKDTTVSISGKDCDIFFGRTKFRSLKQSVEAVRSAPLAAGGCLVEIDLRGIVSDCDRDAGTLNINFTVAPGSDSDAAWAVKQFISDAEIILSETTGISSRLAPCAVQACEIPFLTDVKFSLGKKPETVYRHPEAMIEHEAMTAVELPELGKVDLALPVKIASKGLLSVEQLQAVCYATKSFKSGGGFLLADGTGCGKGRVIAALILHVSLRAFSGGPEAMQAECKRRQTQGRLRRCLWVSTSRDLAKDAERDLLDLGGDQQGVKIWEASSDSSNSELKGNGNVMFITYAALRNSENAKAIANWLGADGEGLIAFDEAHSAKNFASGKENAGSAQGRMVDFLQSACPKAPILYASATACTEVSQMAYMPRLGLWGQGKLFEDFLSFQNAVEGQGYHGMESVALELKARGVAACRSLSHDGTSLSVCEAPADEDRVAAYDRASVFWQKLQLEAEQALRETVDLQSAQAAQPIKNSDESDANGSGDLLQEWMEDLLKDEGVGQESPDSTAREAGELRQFWRAFWACQLRFFGQLVVSMKVPEVKRRVEAALTSQGQVVVTLWGTGEAQLTCGALLADGTPAHGCEAILNQFLLKRFPCPTGYVRSLTLCSEDLQRIFGDSYQTLTECAGSALPAATTKLLKSTARATWELPTTAPLVVSKMRRASDVGDSWIVDFLGATMPEARRAALWAELPRLKLPRHPLDELVDVLGGPTRVAELSGRSNRLLRGKDGKWSVQSRNSDKGPASSLNIREQNAFQTGKKRVAIITEAGSTGISLHSDRERLDIGCIPRQRTMVLAELGFSADKTLQQLGRVHRSNQFSAPRFEVVLSQVPGEARLASALARKLKTLGAVTRGDQHGAGVIGEDRFDQVLSSLDMFSSEASDALSQLLSDTVHSISTADTNEHDPSTDDVAALSSLDISCQGGISNANDDFHTSKAMTRFLGRSMMLPVAQQKRIFKKFHQHLDRCSSGEKVAATNAVTLPIASVCSKDVLTLGHGLPSCRVLHLEVESKPKILLTGPVLSLLNLCPDLKDTWNLTRCRASEHGPLVCGVEVTEMQLNKIKSIALRSDQNVPLPAPDGEKSATGVKRTLLKSGSSPNQKRCKMNSSPSEAALVPGRENGA